MEGFYDKILVDQAKKIGKKHGAKVEAGSIGLGKDLEVRRRGRGLRTDGWYVWDKEAKKIVEKYSASNRLASDAIADPIISQIIKKSYLKIFSKVYSPIICCA